MTGKLKSSITGEGIENPTQLLANPFNYRRHPKEQLDALEGALEELGWIQRVIVNQTTGHMIDGHARVELAIRRAEQEVPVIYVALTERQERIALATLDPITGLAYHDEETLASLLDGLTADNEHLANFLESITPVKEQTRKEEQEEARQGLAELFLVPPFTVLDARAGYWTDRKRLWWQLGIKAEEGRDADCMPTSISKENGYSGTALPGTSRFDPVLAEIVTRWFCPAGGHILDPFGGESTKGIVAAHLGYGYTGVELRQEQVDANNRQAADIDLAPTWITGDSAELHKHLPEAATYDLIWTSPPYYDLEIYSESEKDGSAFETYETFIAWYKDIFAKAVERLKDNRFAVVKIGDIRDKKTGAYRDFVSDNCRIFRELGLHLYNEAILLTPLGTLPVRTAHQFKASRKLGKAHQNVLTFYKGDPKEIEEHFDNHFAALAEDFDKTRHLQRTHDKLLVAYKGDPRDISEHHANNVAVEIDATT